MVLFLPWKEFCIKYYSYSPAIKSGAEFKISSISVSPLTKTFMCEVDGESELEQIIKVVFLKQQRSIIKATHFHFYNCFLSFLFFFFLLFTLLSTPCSYQVEWRSLFRTDIVIPHTRSTWCLKYFSILLVTADLWAANPLCESPVPQPLRGFYWIRIWWLWRRFRHSDIIVMFRSTSAWERNSIFVGSSTLIPSWLFYHWGKKKEKLRL